MLCRALQITGLTLGLSACGLLSPQQEHPEYSYERFQATEGALNYRQLTPINMHPNTRYPLVIVLHGAGERGRDNNRQLTHGADLFLGANRTKYPATVIFPQATKKEYWAAVDANRATRPFTLRFPESPITTAPTRKLIELINSLKTQAHVDPQRIYVMGLSMGGMGTYDLLAHSSIDFAAAIAICGATSRQSAEQIPNDTAIWALHGKLDQIINVQHSVDVVNWVNNTGGNAKLTVYDNAGHNSWDRAFNEPKLLEWLFSHKRAAH